MSSKFTISLSIRYDAFPSVPKLRTKSCLGNVEDKERFIGRIREKISSRKLEISPSAYDTAWVSMVPSVENKQKPHFQVCLEWIVKNQNEDGSWGLDPGHPHLVKDSLSCTLACVLALHKWKLNQRQISRGLDFIASNAWAATDENQICPVGFDITFTGMVKYAKEVSLSLPLDQALVGLLLQIGDSQMRRNQNLEYVSEGLGSSCDWNAVISDFQRTNGSISNSPATTAAVLIHVHDENCMKYLSSVVNACNGWVPTVYPFESYNGLILVDMLKNLGIDRYFEQEIDTILEQVYRGWLSREDELFSDIFCRALAFCLLRKHGYDVSSDELAEFEEQEHLFNKVGTQLNYLSCVHKLYQASKIRIHEEEHCLERIHSWTETYLQQKMNNNQIFDENLRKQLEYDLKNFHGYLDAIRNRRILKMYCLQNFHVLKTAYRTPVIHNEDILLLCSQDFKSCQAQYKEELNQIERWFTGNKLDRLNRGRKILHISYFSTAAVIVGLELSMVRIAYAQTVVLISCIDDFFDLYGSQEEALCVIELVRKWNIEAETSYLSQEVKILFTALYTTVNEVVKKAYVQQGWCMKQELVNMWLELLTSFAREKASWSSSNIRNVDDYIDFSSKSVGCELCVSMSVHFLGMKLEKEMFRSIEWSTLSFHASVVCRLLNDLKTFKREQEEGALNIVSVMTMIENASEEEALLKLEQIVECNRRKVMRMVYKRKGSNIARECKQLFWKTCQIAHFLYSHREEMNSLHLMMLLRI